MPNSTPLTGFSRDQDQHLAKLEDDLQAIHLGARRGAPVQWWYYNGHLRAGGRRFSFHAAFFRFDAAYYRIGSWIPLRLLGRSVSFAHLSVTDHAAKSTQFAQRRAFRWGNRASASGLHVRVKDWVIRGDTREHRLRIGFEDCRLSLNLELTKPIISYGTGGLFESVLPRSSAHYSCPRMTVAGSIRIHGDVHEVKGTAWMDREYGVVGPDETVAGWVWMSIQMPDGREMMVYRLARRNCAQTHLRAAIIDQGGSVRIVDDHEIQLHPKKTWMSEKTGVQYPVSWMLRVPGERLELVIDAIFDAVEFDTRGTTSTVYWEGPAAVRGVRKNARISGDAFVEIVGHLKQPLPGHFDHARRSLPLLGYFANEMRFRFLGASCYRIQHGDSF